MVVKQYKKVEKESIKTGKVKSFLYGDSKPKLTELKYLIDTS